MTLSHFTQLVSYIYILKKKCQCNPDLRVQLCSVSSITVLSSRISLKRTVKLLNFDQGLHYNCLFYIDLAKFVCCGSSITSGRCSSNSSILVVVDFQLLYATSHAFTSLYANRHAQLSSKATLTVPYILIKNVNATSIYVCSCDQGPVLSLIVETIIVR